MKKLVIFTFFLSIMILSCKKSTEAKKETVKETKTSALNIYPIKHATTVLTYKDEIIYIDPTGGAEAFKNFNAPTLVFITDVHGDHMNLKTLNSLNLTKSTIIAPKAVAENLNTISAKEIIVINNGETKTFENISVEAIPMYNLREEALKFHNKGRGNGYIFTIDDERVYFSGDTEDIPEMRALKNIDKAFVCMNLPYTMTVESAADAVLEFKPKQVYPYHYRGTNGMSDIAKFKNLVNNGNKDIEVIQLKWY